VYLDQHTNQQFTPDMSSVSVTASTGNWRQMDIFIDLLCPAVHTWVLTATLLWCWSLTRPALCLICAGVYRCGATDIKGKRVCSYGRSGKLKSYSTQISQSTLFNKPTSVLTAVNILISFFISVFDALWRFKWDAATIWEKKSIGYFV
jgi:hypothetical protein